MIFILTLIAVASSYPLYPKEICSCRKYATETTCAEVKKCKWTRMQCFEKTCAQYYNEVDCDNATGCSWNISKCTTFTKCSDFYANNPQRCYLKGADFESLSCRPVMDLEVDSGKCEDVEYKSCPAMKEYLSCNGFQSRKEICYWDGSACLTIPIQICSGLINEYLCKLYGDGLGCWWKNGKCLNKKCEDYTIPRQCVLGRADDINEPFTACFWDSKTDPKNPVCIPAANLDHISQFDCFELTLKTHLWDDASGKCTPCKELPDAKPKTND